MFPTRIDSVHVTPAPIIQPAKDNDLTEDDHDLFLSGSKFKQDDKLQRRQSDRVVLSSPDAKKSQHQRFESQPAVPTPQQMLGSMTAQELLSQPKLVHSYITFADKECAGENIAFMQRTQALFLSLPADDGSLSTEQRKILQGIIEKHAIDGDREFARDRRIKSSSQLVALSSNTAKQAEDLYALLRSNSPITNKQTRHFAQNAIDHVWNSIKFDSFNRFLKTLEEPSAFAHASSRHV
jgi:hypothetical protein